MWRCMNSKKSRPMPSCTLAAPWVAAVADVAPTVEYSDSPRVEVDWARAVRDDLVIGSNVGYA